MRFSELKASVRRERVCEAVDGILRRADLPMSTGELVKAATTHLDARDCQDWIARAIVDLTKTHPSARQTGEVFVRYGREMRKWEWLPSHARTTKPSAAELQRRRERIAALEADDDMWTVHPEPPAQTEEFLDDQGD